MPIDRETYRKMLDRYSGADPVGDLQDEFLSLWQDDYLDRHGHAELLVVQGGSEEGGFQYLFDLTRERNVVAFGIPKRNAQRRDAGRIAGHPQSSGSQYHRGHLIAHSLGGGMDINLVSQLGCLNTGAFRKIERAAKELANSGARCFYIVRAIYADDSSQLPYLIEQCLIQQSKEFSYAMHMNVL